MGAMTKDEINVSLFDEVKRLQKRLAECEPVIETVRYFCESFEVNSERWSSAAWRQKVREIYRSLPEKRTP